MWEYQQTDELYHYGILGMKWGMRRAYSKNIPYSYKTHAQKKYEKKLNKINTKIYDIKSKNKKISYSMARKQRNIEKKYNLYKQRDAHRQDYAETTSIGKSIAKTMLFGPFGVGNYNRFRASGHGRIVSALGSNYISSTLGYPLTGLISKNSENRAARIINKKK